MRKPTLRTNTEDEAKDIKFDDSEDGRSLGLDDGFGVDDVALQLLSST